VGDKPDEVDLARHAWASAFVASPRVLAALNRLESAFSRRRT
jgi:hypothetical protein